MAQQDYKLSLKDTLFPLLSEQQSRTTILAPSSTGEEADKPSLAYCHNVMPTKLGFNSVSYLPVVSAYIGTVLFSDARIVYSDTRERTYLAWSTLGRVLVKVAGVWSLIPATVPATGGASFDIDSVTIATVNGVSYIFYSGIGAFTYNSTTKKLDAVTLTGLTIADVLGLVASSGYLIAYTADAIAWSSTILATDFVPSTVTGAGGGNVAGIAGDILFATSNSLGLIVYTAANALAGTYTGNVQYPFKFREIEDSKGGLSLGLTAYEANSGEQYVYSKAGIQTLTSRAAKLIIPEVTDFLAGGRFEDFDEVTKTFTTTDLTATMVKGIKFIASRYLVISYGIASFTHVLVYDVGLQKLGKLKIDHVDVFEYVADQVEVSKETVAFLQVDGTVKLLDFSITSTSSGVALLGKLQYVRSRLINLHEVELENIAPSSTLSLDDLYTMDGKTFQLATGALVDSSTEVRSYHFHTNAINHSLLLIGQFNLVTAQIAYSIGSRR